MNVLWMSHVTRMNTLCHVWMRRVGYEWVNECRDIQVAVGHTAHLCYDVLRVNEFCQIWHTNESISATTFKLQQVTRSTCVASRMKASCHTRKESIHVCVYRRGGVSHMTKTSARNSGVFSKEYSHMHAGHSNPYIPGVLTHPYTSALYRQVNIQSFCTIKLQ